MLDDIRYAIRSLRRSPGFVVAAVLILAIGIGAGAAMFSLVDAYYLRPLPGVAAPDRLVEVQGVEAGQVVGGMTYLDFADLRRRNPVFSGVMAYCPVVLDVGQGGETRRVPAAVVSSDYFAVLGAGISRGRGLLADEEQPAHAHPVAVVSYRLWRTVFEADTGIVGSRATLNGRDYTVVGVAAPGFRGHLTSQAIDIWVPLSMAVEANPQGLVSLDNRIWRWLTVVARLAPGVGLPAARAGANVVARQLESAGAGEGRGFGLSLEPTRQSLLHDTYALLVVGGVCALFLAVCANLSNLFLARAGTRRKEIATRLALGAPRSRVVRRLLAESLLLGLAAGVIGFALATPTAAAALVWSSANVQEFADSVSPHATAALALFVLAISIVGSILLGLGPALQVSGVDVAASLKEGVGGRTAGRSRMRGVLVAAQLSVSLTLLSGGGLLYETLRGNRSLVTIPDPGRVLLMSVQPSHQGYSVERSRELFRQLQERVARLPGVRSASVARDLSIDDGSFFEDGVAAEPRDPTSGAVRVKAGYDVISPDYFGTLGVPLVGGREISVDDRSGAPPVVIVNATLARRLWPGQDPLGRTLRIEGEKSGRTVAGVARDRPTRDGPRPFFYYPLSQHYPWPGSSHLLHVRTAGDPMGLVAAIRREAAALDARLPLYKPRLLTREIAGRQFFERFAGAVIGGSGLLALLLSAIGLYGVTSHWVSVRTQEIGVRVALGARPDGIVRLVMGQALKLVAAGVGIGLVAALALNRALSSVLFGARPAGPLALVMASLVLIGVAMLTSWLPARRASRVDPVVALRSE